MARLCSHFERSWGLWRLISSLVRIQIQSPHQWCSLNLTNGQRRQRKIDIIWRISSNQFLQSTKTDCMFILVCKYPTSHWSDQFPLSTLVYSDHFARKVNLCQRKNAKPFNFSFSLFTKPHFQYCTMKRSIVVKVVLCVCKVSFYIGNFMLPTSKFTWLIEYGA